MTRTGILVFFVAALLGALVVLLFRGWPNHVGYMPHMGFYGVWMIGALLISALVLILLVGTIRPNQQTTVLEAKRLLDQRLARGDITETEYRDIRTILKGGEDA